MKANLEICNWREVLGWAKPPARKEIMQVITDLGLTILTQSVGKHIRTFWVALEEEPTKFEDPSPYKDTLEKALNDIVPGSIVTIPGELYSIPSDAERITRYYKNHGWGKKKKILLVRVPVQREFKKIERNVIKNRLQNEVDMVFEDIGVRSMSKGTSVRLWKLGNEPWTSEEIIQVERVFDSLEAPWELTDTFYDPDLNINFRSYFFKNPVLR